MAVSEGGVGAVVVASHGAAGDGGWDIFIFSCGTLRVGLRGVLHSEYVGL